MWQAAEPFAQQLIDLGGREIVANPLRQLDVGAGLDPIIEGFEWYASLGQLALEVFVAIDVELGVVRKVGTDLQEEGAEVLIDAVEVVVIDHRGCVHNPRIGSSRLCTAPLLRPHHSRLLLGLADIEDAFRSLEASQVLLRDVVLALPLLEAHQIDALAVDERLDVANERLGHRRHRRRRGKSLAPMLAQEPHDAPYRLQQRHVDVEVHPVDPLELQNHVITQDVRHRSCYRHRGLRSSTGPRAHRASSSYIQGMSLQARPESTLIRDNPPVLGSRRTPFPKRSPSTVARSRNVHTAPPVNVTRAASSNRIRLRPTSYPTIHPHNDTPRRSEAEPR
jgi:hypothetical protein